MGCSTQDIDFVIAWVDGSSAEWQERRNKQKGFDDRPDSRKRTAKRHERSRNSGMLQRTKRAVWSKAIPDSKKTLISRTNG